MPKIIEIHYTGGSKDYESKDYGKLYIKSGSIQGIYDKNDHISHKR